jgi:hypothetical protein
MKKETFIKTVDLICHWIAKENSLNEKLTTMIGSESFLEISAWVNDMVDILVSEMDCPYNEYFGNDISWYLWEPVNEVFLGDDCFTIDTPGKLWCLIHKDFDTLSELCDDGE